MSGEDDGDQTAITDLAVLLTPERVVKRHAYVIVLAGQNVGAIHRLTVDAATLGRGATCEIRLPDDGISRQHARLVRRSDSEILLEDLGSTNGTFVDGERVSSRLLCDGDRFQLGRTTLLKFSLSDELEESFQRRLYESSVRDGLTLLYNRKHLDERLAAEFSYATRHGAPLSFIIFDLDRFKRVNDIHGHQAGDAVLRAVGRKMHAALRTEDVVARYGGEEFAILARGINVHQAAMLADRIRAIIEDMEVVAGPDLTLKVTVSGGVATHNPTPYSSASALVEAADRALYEAKEKGRNRVVMARV